MPATTLVPLAAVRLVYTPQRHPCEAEMAKEIETYWQQRHAANPRLYDGESVLFCGAKLHGDVLEAEARPIRYAGLLRFLTWPEMLPWRHIYCNAALIGADGRAVMARHSAHTANGDRVYFPSGTFDPADFPDGLGDLERNMCREVMEETGISLSAATPEAGYWLWDGGRNLAIFRLYRFAETADRIAEAIEHHLASGADDELAGAVVVEPGETLEAMPASAVAFMRWFRG